MTPLPTLPTLPTLSYWTIWKEIKRKGVAYVAAPPPRFKQIRKALRDAKYKDIAWHMTQDTLIGPRPVLHFEERPDDFLLIITLTHRTDWSIL